MAWKPWCAFNRNDLPPHGDQTDAYDCRADTSLANEHILRLRREQPSDPGSASPRRFPNSTIADGTRTLALDQMLNFFFWGCGGGSLLYNMLCCISLPHDINCVRTTMQTYVVCMFKDLMCSSWFKANQQWLLPNSRSQYESVSFVQLLILQA